MSKYVIGIDYGTLSGRAVLVDAADGTIVAEAALDYPHGVMDRTLPDGTPLPGSWALQDPRDYLEVLEKTVPQVLKDSGVDPEDVIGLGLDTTSATLIPVGEDGLPLSFHEKWAAVPHAWCKLWKHHAAQAQAERFTTLMGEDLLSHYGGRVSSEWVYPKILEVREEAPEVYEAADRFLDACDWLTAWLTGETLVSACSAGYKAFWRKGEGYPSPKRVAQVAPYMADVAETKLDAPVLALGQPVGCLTEEACRLTGLTTRCVVAVGNVDAHASVPGSGLSRPGELLVILGTSACSMVCAEQEHFVPGICGSVMDGILPGLYGYEAGQPSVGDTFSWFVKNFAAEEGFGGLDEKAKALKIGESGLIALDWWNGNRSILNNADLSGVIFGLTLQTRPEEIYRALIESCAFGFRTIIENFESHGVPVEQVYACGGISLKNPFLVQLYADVIGRSIRVSPVLQSPALGSAMTAAAAAGCYPSLQEAVRAMARTDYITYEPDMDAHVAYDHLFLIYRKLHDTLGRDLSVLMQELNKGGQLI